MSGMELRGTRSSGIGNLGRFRELSTFPPPRI